MEKPYLPPPAPSKGGEYTNLSSTMMFTQPSTLLPYFSLNEVMRLILLVDILLLRLFRCLNEGKIRLVEKYPVRDKRLVEKGINQEHSIPSGMQPHRSHVAYLRHAVDTGNAFSTNITSLRDVVPTILILKSHNLKSNKSTT